MTSNVCSGGLQTDDLITYLAGMPKVTIAYLGGLVADAPERRRPRRECAGNVPRFPCPSEEYVNRFLKILLTFASN
jgi:hypothetical protein